MILISFNFRPAISSVPPLLELIKTDLNLSYFIASLLTTIPTLSMGIFALLAVPFSRFFGREKAIFYAVFLIGIATFSRLWGSNLLLLLGTTIVLGVGIAIAQTLLPSFVKAHFPNRAAIITGLYATSLTLGAAVAAGLSVPLSDLFGNWTFSLAFWSIFSIIALIVWFPLIGQKHSDSPSHVSVSSVFPKTTWSNTWVWAISLFLALVTLLFYSVLSWLSPLYMSLGWSANDAGVLLTVFLLTQLLGTASISALADSNIDRRPWIFFSLALSAVGLFAITISPLYAPFLWVSILGIGLGGIFPLSMTLPIDYSSDEGTAEKLTSIVLFFGYSLAAIGPSAIGLIRDIFGDYYLAFFSLFFINLLALLFTFKFKPGISISLP
tara:strand:+ start:202 stop:1347 length:1146 start_codon:yes stop_codon:yes gene_type:complete